MITHGMSYSRTYQAWNSMRKRCKGLQPRYKRDYTDRGITFCCRWNKFSNFLADMGVCPDGMTLDRWPNNNGNYEPGNCRWANMAEQSRNRRTTVLTEEDVRLIRSSPMQGVLLAKAMGISRWVVYNVRQRKSWKEI